MKTPRKIRIKNKVNTEGPFIKRWDVTQDTKHPHTRPSIHLFDVAFKGNKTWGSLDVVHYPKKKIAHVTGLFPRFVRPIDVKDNKKVYATKGMLGVKGVKSIYRQISSKFPNVESIVGDRETGMGRFGRRATIKLRGSIKVKKQYKVPIRKKK